MVLNKPLQTWEFNRANNDSRPLISMGYTDAQIQQTTNWKLDFDVELMDMEGQFRGLSVTDFGIHGVWVGGQSWNQSLVDTKGWLYLAHSSSVWKFRLGLARWFIWSWVWSLMYLQSAADWPGWLISTVIEQLSRLVKLVLMTEAGF